MGIDRHGMAFLLKCKNWGVDFRHTLMLGRQEFTIPRIAFQNISSRFNLKTDVGDLIFSQPLKYSEPFFQILGANPIESIDASDYETPTYVHDFNLPIADNLKCKYTCVFDGGTLEHVFNYPQAVKNCMDMLEVNGHFISITPANNLMGHGFYQFSPELMFRLFSKQNGFINTMVYLFKVDGKNEFYKVKDPAETGGRIMLCNSDMMYMAVVSRKEAHMEIKHLLPQQSDYSQLWAIGKSKSSPKSVWRNVLEKLMPSDAYGWTYSKFLLWKDRRQMSLNNPNYVVEKF